MGNYYIARGLCLQVKILQLCCFTFCVVVSDTAYMVLFYCECVTSPLFFKYSYSQVRTEFDGITCTV
jgi:hypothetical protein